MSELGIEVGDVVWTSYGSGPYRVKRVVGPYRDRYDPATCTVKQDGPPMWSLVLEDLGKWYGPPINRFVRHNGELYINEIRAPRRGRWFTWGGDEIFVRKRAAGAALQPDMFYDLEFARGGAAF